MLKLILFANKSHFSDAHSFLHVINKYILYAVFAIRDFEPSYFAASMLRRNDNNLINNYNKSMIHHRVN
jgi:hypothetical protein